MQPWEVADEPGSHSAHATMAFARSLLPEQLLHPTPAVVYSPIPQRVGTGVGACVGDTVGPYTFVGAAVATLQEVAAV